MDWLYRVFYTVLSLGILMILIFPFVAAFRFLLRRIHKKYTVWGWWLFFFRSICPVALSSALCMVPYWNRQYHSFLSGLGLTIRDQSGIMRSWSAVFKNDIIASTTFKICSIIWAAGVLGILLSGIINYQKIRRELHAAKVVGENIYESAVLSEPVRLGFLHEKLYLPKGFQAKEMTWLLRHMECHRREGFGRVLLLFIMACHWFNPVMWLYYYWWNMDAEMAADDRTVYKKSQAERREYAQGILNFSKESGNRGRLIIRGPFFLGVAEKNTQKRAYRMMFQRGDTVNGKLLGILLLSLATIVCFLLRPMQIAWSGGTWGNSGQQKEEESLFDKKNVSVVTRMKTTSPEGLARVIQLEMVTGTENQNGYDGTFVIKMYDTLGNEIASYKVEDIFSETKKGELHFSKNVTLCISDYNGDDVQELVIGQQGTFGPEATPVAKLQQGEAAYTYALVNIEDKKLEILCNDITAAGNINDMSESIPFEKPEGIHDIFIVPFGEETFHYVWNSNSGTYEKRTMSEEELENHKRNADASSGETKEHTLEDEDGTAVVLVTTRQDSTQSEVIQSVTLFPRGKSKRFDDIQGYFCDLLWVDADGEKNRYAQIIYNGTKAQTFVIYDTERKSVYYQQEDGAEPLASVFALYRVDDITFKEGGAVIYELAEKNDDVIKIKFVAEADNNVTVNGSYEYNITRKIASNFSFSRSTGEDTQATPETSN